jgi:hypothetical protein
VIDHQLATTGGKQQGAPRQLQCPECEGSVVRRSHRCSLWERLLSAARVYPFRCDGCNYRFKVLLLGGSRGVTRVSR